MLPFNLRAFWTNDGQVLLLRSRFPATVDRLPVLCILCTTYYVLTISVGILLTARKATFGTGISWPRRETVSSHGLTNIPLRSLTRWTACSRYLHNDTCKHDSTFQLPFQPQCDYIHNIAKSGLYHPPRCSLCLSCYRFHSTLHGPVQCFLTASKIVPAPGESV